jgi:hypothetical protein
MTKELNDTLIYLKIKLLPLQKIIIIEDKSVAAGFSRLTSKLPARYFRKFLKI